MKKTVKFTISSLVILAILGVAATVYAHCQIPCGIYDDPARVTAMAEHITTIEKSMNQITAQSKESTAQGTNQSVRWVMNKEKHADELSEIITYYFMAQRIKPSTEANKEAYTKYIKELTLLHQMLQTTMKAKQTVDLAQVAQLKSLLHDFSDSYLGPLAGHTH
ncbi:MAG: superoxide dismutase, Ni [Phycisphaerae bacterium]|nr:superoxide dismutase, Ni [Phycisphaerae bacterium]